MFAPIAAIIFAIGSFSTPQAVKSEQEWLAQHRSAPTELQCARTDRSVPEAGDSARC